MDNKKINIIKNGFLNYAITLESEFLNDELLNYLIKKVNFKNIPLSVLIKNEKILSRIHETNISSDKIMVDKTTVENTLGGSNKGIWDVSVTPYSEGKKNINYNKRKVYSIS